jgi:hypothetical protein
MRIPRPAAATTVNHEGNFSKLTAEVELRVDVKVGLEDDVLVVACVNSGTSIYDALTMLNSVSAVVASDESTIAPVLPIPP